MLQISVSLERKPIQKFQPVRECKRLTLYLYHIHEHFTHLFHGLQTCVLQGTSTYHFIFNIFFKNIQQSYVQCTKKFIAI